MQAGVCGVRSCKSTILKAYEGRSHTQDRQRIGLRGAGSGRSGFGHVVPDAELVAQPYQ